MACVNETPPPPPCTLRVLLSSLADDNTETAQRRLCFRPDSTKKSAFWLDAPTTTTMTTAHGKQEHTNNDNENNGLTYEMAAPALCCIDCTTGVFALGGFQLVSNAKNIEIYTERDGRQTYLMTSRGIPVAEPAGGCFFQTMCVVPGGPRPVDRVHLKLASLKKPLVSGGGSGGGDEETTAKLVWMKLTARIPKATPEAAAQASRAATTTATTTTTTAATTRPAFSAGALPANAAALAAMADSFPKQTAAVNMDDIGAAMGGVSFMVRSTEERLVETLRNGFGRLEHLTTGLVQQGNQSSDTRHSSTDQRLQSLVETITMQSQLLQRQCETMQQQSTILEQQNAALECLKQQQGEMLEAFVGMQQELIAVTASTTAVHAIGHKQTAAAAANESDKWVMDDSHAIDEQVPDPDLGGGESEKSYDTLDVSDVVFVNNEDGQGKESSEAAETEVSVAIDAHADDTRLQDGAERTNEHDTVPANSRE